MTTRLFYDKDCDLSNLTGKTIVFIGYGNQGRAEALNLRDTFKEANTQVLGNASSICLYIGCWWFLANSPFLGDVSLRSTSMHEMHPTISPAHDVEGAERSPLECCSGVHVSVGMLGAATHPGE